MALPTLAEIADIEATLSRPLTDAQVTFATRLLALASGLVRRYTRQTITKVENDVFTVEGSWGNSITLPQRPVRSVSSVVMNGATMPNTQWKLIGDELFLGTGSFMPDYGSTLWGGSALWGPAGSNIGPQVTGATWQGPQSSVVITYTHGYDEVPADITNEVAGMVALQLNTEAGVNNEQIGGYKIAYDRNSGGGMGLTDDTKQVLNFYRKRATSSSVATRR